MKKLFTFILAAVTSIGMWAETCTINCNTTSTDALFSVAEELTQYDYNSNWSTYNLIKMDVGASITITNVTGATISAVSVEGVADNNSNKTVNFTMSDGTTTATTSSGSWNNRKSSSLTSKALNATNVAKMKHGIGQTYTITNNSSSSYNAGVRIVITYTPAAPAVTHTLTWDFAGGSCSATAGTNYTAGGDVAEGATITYPANNTMSKDGYDFNGWSTSVTTMPTSDLTITAQWIEHTTQSSDATLSALSVAGCTLSPAFASDTTAYTVALPFYASMPAVGDVTATKNDSYAKDPEVTIADNVISIACEAEDGTKKTYTITVNIADVPAASTSINIEQLVLDNSKSYSYTSALTAANISYANLNGLDSLAIGDADNSRPDYNEPFLGLKIKKSGGYIQMVIPAGKTLKVKFGSVAADLKLTINGVAQSDISKSISVYEHTATGNELIKIATSSDKTVVIKQIMIDEDIAVVRPFEATIAATTNGTASVELAKYAKGEEVTVNCVPASGYKLASIAVSGYNDKGAETDVTVTGNKFTMPGSPVTITVTFSIATSISNTSDAAKAQKRIENGQLVIEKNGQVFNAMGQTIR